MTNQNPQPSVKLRRWRPWLILCLIALLLIVGFYCYSTIRQAQAEARLHALIAEMEKVDSRWKLSALNPEYQEIPVSPAYTKCFASLPPGYRGWAWDDIPTRPGSIDYWPEGRDYHLRMPEPYYKILNDLLTDAKVQPMRKALKELLQEKAGYRMPDSTGNKYKYQYIEDAKRMTCIISDESLFAAHQGDGDHVVRAFQMSMNVARLFEQSPILIDLLCVRSFRNRAVADVNHALAITQLTDAHLQQLQSILDHQTLPGLHPLLRSYRATFFDEWEAARTDSQTRSNLIGFCLSPLGQSGTWKERAKYWVERINVESTLGNMPARQVELLEFTAQLLDIESSQPKQLMKFISDQKVESNNILLKNSLTGCEKLVKAHYTNQALVNSFRAALACERYRLAQGKWPASLDVLVPQYLSVIPFDPFSDKQLLYRLLPDGVVIYSVGVNGVDDQGDVLETNGSPKDRGTRLFNPELRGKKFEQRK